MESSMKAHDVLEYRPQYEKLYCKDNVKISVEKCGHQLNDSGKIACCKRYELWVKKSLKPKRVQ